MSVVSEMTEAHTAPGGSPPKGESARSFFGTRLKQIIRCRPLGVNAKEVTAPRLPFYSQGSLASAIAQSLSSVDPDRQTWA